MNPEDKRLARRRQSDYVVEFYETEGLLLLGVGRLLDLSATGALVESRLRLVPGRTLHARILRPNEDPIELPTEVVRVREKGTVITYGLHFLR